MGYERYRSGRLDLRVPASGERFDEVARWPGVLVEHIVSSSTPDPAEQRQEHDEWVLLLEGEATLDIDGTTVGLSTGDWLLIPARTRHSVRDTATGTRWLAVHMGVDDPLSN